MLFFNFIVAMLVTMVVIVLLMRCTKQLQLADIPNTRKVHSEAIPRIGGLAMATGAALPILMWGPRGREVTGLLIGIAIIALFGIWDDRRNLDYRLKFLGQIIAALAAIIYGGLRIEAIPFPELDLLPAYWSIPLTILVLVGAANAINLADGLDGLAGGMTLLSFSVIAVLAHMVDNTVVLLVTLAMMGSVFGFLRFNTYPAQIFMGDTGSQYLGFSMGVLAIMLAQKAHTPLSSALPVMLLGVPILDTLVVIVQRIYERRSPFVADKNHVHHKLLALGFSHPEAVFLIYMVQAGLVIGAYALRYQSDALILGLYGAFCVAVIVFFHWAARAGWRAHAHGSRYAGWFLPKPMRWDLYKRGVFRWVSTITLGTISLYFFLGATLTPKIRVDTGVLATGLLVISLACYLKQRGKPINWIERVCIYMTAILVTYLVQTSPAFEHVELYRYIGYLSFGILASAATIGLLWDKRFHITPLDFLVIFIGLTVPILYGSPVHDMGSAKVIAAIIVMLYAMEWVITSRWPHYDTIRLVVLVTLGVAGLRGMVLS